MHLPKVKNQIREKQAGNALAIRRAIEFTASNWQKIEAELSSGDLNIYSLKLLPRMIEKSMRISSKENWILPNYQSIKNKEDYIHHSDRVYEKIEEEVKELRTEVFGSPQPEFLSFMEAMQWIESKFAQGHKRQVGPNISGLEETIEDKYQEYSEKFISISPNLPSNKISFGAFDKDEIQWVQIANNDLLCKFAEFQKNSSKKTGLTESALFLYFTMGVKSVVPRWRLRDKTSYTNEEKQNQAGPNTKFEIETFYPNVNLEDLKDAYDVLRTLKRFDKPIYIKKKDKALMDSMRELGGLPASGSGREEFWEEALELCQNKGIEDWKSKSSVKSRWSRLRQKLIELGQSDLIDRIESPKNP